MERIVVYLQSGNLINTSPEYVAGTLIKELGFTKKQSDNAIKYASSRGECLIFEGKKEDVINLMDKLNKAGITCRATPRGMLK